METISLRVTKKVLVQIPRSTGQEQIAVNNPTLGIAEALARANRKARIRVKIAERLDLWIGDTGAIWRAYNKENLDAFDILFSMLSEKPDDEFLFVVRELSE